MVGREVKGRDDKGVLWWRGRSGGRAEQGDGRMKRKAKVMRRERKEGEVRMRVKCR